MLPSEQGYFFLWHFHFLLFCPDIYELKEHVEVKKTCNGNY